MKEKIRLFVFSWKIIFYRILNIYYKFRGIKILVYTVYNDYFFDMFLPMYLKLKDDKRLRMFFCYVPENKNLKKYLLKYVRRKYIGISPYMYYINPDICITSEIHNPEMFKHLGKKTKKVQMYHGIGVYNHYVMHELLAKFDAHFLIGPQFKELVGWILREHNKTAKIYAVGFPKLDKLFYLKKNSKNLNKKIILYAPHWRKYSSLYRFDLEIIKKLNELGNVKIYVKVHNHLFFENLRLLKKIKTFCKNLENVVFIEQSDSSKLYPISDIVITDTGSTAGFEASVVGKPLFLYYNEQWFKDNEHYDVEKNVAELAFKFENLEDLMKNLQRFFANDSYFLRKINHQKILQKQLVRKYLYNPGTATDYAVKAILKELGFND